MSVIFSWIYFFNPANNIPSIWSSSFANPFKTHKINSNNTLPRVDFCEMGGYINVVNQSINHLHKISQEYYLRNVKVVEHF